MNVLLNVVIMFVVLASIPLWLHAGRKLQSRRPLLFHEARRQVPWGVIDILVAIFLQIVVAGLADELFRRKYGIKQAAKIQEFGIEVFGPYFMVMTFASLGATA